MKLQIALDRIDLETAITLADQVQNHADIIEVGTSLIKEYGFLSVRLVKQAAASTAILADIKTMDEGEYEFRSIYQSNADLATVMGAAALSTVAACYRVSEEKGHTLMIDLLETSEERVKTLTQFKHALFCVHFPKDGGSSDIESRIHDFVKHHPHIEHVAVAGGVRLEHVPWLRRLGVEVCIVGSEIIESKDPLYMAETFYHAVHDGNE
ncbi:MAG: orotidine 5'-phosphate decarboxylase [Acidibacillus sp.]|nr:orotidine 5'-phosphate decarboxylase [Acidibacillus sp.]